MGSQIFLNRRYPLRSETTWRKISGNTFGTPSSIIGGGILSSFSCRLDSPFAFHNLSFRKHSIFLLILQNPALIQFVCLILSSFLPYLHSILSTPPYFRRAPGYQIQCFQLLFENPFVSYPFLFKIAEKRKTLRPRNRLFRPKVNGDYYPEILTFLLSRNFFPLFCISLSFPVLPILYFLRKIA